MAGIIERLGSMASTDVGKAITLAHETYNARMQEHAQSGRAILETIAHVAKVHPAVFGLAAVFLLEVIAAEEHHRHETHPGATHPGATSATPATAPAGAGGGLHLPHLEAPHLAVPNLHVPTLRVDHIRPGKVAMEVFGALVLLKFATFGARMFRRKSPTDVWFAPASRIHLFSGALGAYYVAKSLRSPKVSAWRNAAAALFVTDALKPMLKAPKGRRKAPAARSAPLAMATPVAAPFATGPTPTAPTPLTPVSGPGGPTGGAPAPAPTAEPAPAPTTGPANDPSTASIEVTPGQVFAASPQFWTPPPRPNRETVNPTAPMPETVATAAPRMEGPEHAAAAPTLEAPSLASSAPASSAPASSATGGQLGDIPSGEIIQWTGFTGAGETASRLAD